MRRFVSSPLRPSLRLLLLAATTLSGCASAVSTQPTPNTPNTPTAPVCPPLVSAPGAPAPSGRIAYAAGDDFDIAVVHADGSGPHRLTANAGPEFSPTWSPDGAHIAYRDSRRGINHDDEIYMMNADGTEQANLTRHPADDW